MTALRRIATWSALAAASASMAIGAMLMIAAERLAPPGWDWGDD
jgi:hypothetical protein